MEQLIDSSLAAPNNDVILWPDDVWCFRYELLCFNHKSDDYKVIKTDTQEYIDFFGSV